MRLKSPVELDNQDKVDAPFFFFVADNLTATQDQLERVTVRLLLSDPNAESLPDAERLSKVNYPSQ